MYGGMPGPLTLGTSDIWRRVAIIRKLYCCIPVLLAVVKECRRCLIFALVSSVEPSNLGTVSVHLMTYSEDGMASSPLLMTFRSTDIDSGPITISLQI